MSPACSGPAAATFGSVEYVDSSQGSGPNEAQPSDEIEQWRAYVPVENLDLQVPEVDVGGARLCQMTPGTRSELLETLAGSADGTLAAPELRAEMRRAIDEHFLPFFEGRACLQFALAAPEPEVESAVIARAEEILSLLRLYAGAFHPPSARARIGISGRVLSGAGILVAVSDRGAHIPYETTGALFPCKMDAEGLETARERLHFEDLGAVVAKEHQDRTEYERRLLTALQWLGAALEEDRLPEKVVALATALEALLLTGEVEKITNELAERVAIALHDKLCERKKTKGRMKKLYALRSKVVHRGERDVDEGQAQELETIVLRTVVSMAPRQASLKTGTDVDAWFEDTRLG